MSLAEKEFPSRKSIIFLRMVSCLSWGMNDSFGLLFNAPRLITVLILATPEHVSNKILSPVQIISTAEQNTYPRTFRTLFYDQKIESQRRKLRIFAIKHIFYDSKKGFGPRAAPEQLFCKLLIYAIVYIMKT